VGVGRGGEVEVADSVLAVHLDARVAVVVHVLFRVRSAEREQSRRGGSTMGLEQPL
jgi:hypothetical protein